MCNLPFQQVWLLDFEFQSLPGERPQPVCLVAREVRTGQTFRLWQDEMKQSLPPFPVGRDCCFLAYYASAEVSCFLALDWPIPTHIIDLYVEFRNLTNGQYPFAGSGLLGALVYFGLESISHGEKDAMRQLVMRGGPWTGEERVAILDYCQTDVDALAKLLPSMEPHLDVDRALLRGRYMAAVARMEWEGIPIDVPRYHRLLAHWEDIQDELIGRVNWDFYRVYDKRRFRSKVWDWYLLKNDIFWPRTAAGRLDLKQSTFETMVKQYPQIAPIYNLRSTIGKMRLKDMPVGHDGRNRCLLSPFRARTSRNQPSSKAFVFGTAAWLRGLIKPRSGRGLAYLDWSQQEFAIGATLSGDRSMQAAYEEGDPYMSLARQAGAVPEDATKETHGKERTIFKQLALAVQYGIGPEEVGRRIGKSKIEAEALLMAHKRRYRAFWDWSEGVVRYAILYGRLWSILGWNRLYPRVKLESARNFPIQSCGAEMLRIAIILAQDAGIQVLAPVHDAVLIEFDLSREIEVVDSMQQIMAQASRIVLDGFALRTEPRIVRYSDRYMEDRGREVWDLAWEIVNHIEKGDL